MSLPHRTTLASDPARAFGRIVRNGIPKAELLKIGREDQEEPSPGEPCAACGRALPFPALLVGWTLNAELQALQRGNEYVLFSDAEWRLLAALMRAPGKVWSNEMLREAAWNGVAAVSTVPMTMHRLRKRLESVGIPGDTIETLGTHGAHRRGYRVRLGGWRLKLEGE